MSFTKTIMQVAATELPMSFIPKGDGEYECSTYVASSNENVTVDLESLSLQEKDTLKVLLSKLRTAALLELGYFDGP